MDLADPAAVGGAPGTVTGSLAPMPMGSDGKPTSLSALPADEQPEADQGGEAQLAPNLRRQEVTFVTKEPAGTIVVNTYERYLYHVEGGGRATRYGVAVGEEGLTLKGEASVGRKAEWPSWTPTASMIRRKPHLAQYAGGVEGGPNNPLGARALYIGATLYRIHGTNEPWTIGGNVSSGCIRMVNEDVIDLYSRAKIGAKVIVL